MKIILKLYLTLRKRSSKLGGYIDRHPFLTIAFLLLLTAINLLNGRNNNAFIYFLIFIINFSGYILLKRNNVQKNKFDVLTDNLLNLSIFLIIFFTSVAAIASVVLSDFIYVFGSKYGTTDAWVQFLGALFGGSLTLVALAFTIKLTSHQNQLLVSANLMPVLTCQNTFFEQSETISKGLVLKLENASNNSILNLKIEKLSVVVIDQSNSERTYSEIGENGLTLSTNLLNPKGNQIFNPIGLSVDQILRDKYLRYVDIKILFRYTDIFESTRYILKYTARFHLQNNKHGASYYSSQENERLLIKEYIFVTEENKYEKVEQNENY